MTRKFKQTEIGKIPKDWVKKTLGELVTFQRGHDLPLRERKPGPYPIIASNGIVGYHNEYKAKGPGVTIGRSGNLGEPFYIDRDYWPHNTTLYSIEFHNSDPRFVYYFLKTMNLKNFNAGSAVPTLNRNHIHPIEVIIPKDISDQRAIAKILSDLDEKIELNRQMNKTFESIAQAIFKHWFVDFEFPNEQGKPYRSSGGKMVESKLGKIPKEWRVGALSQILKVGLSGDWGRDDNFEGAVQAVSLRGTDLEKLKSNGYSSSVLIRWILKEKLVMRLINDCDILIGGSGLGPIGRSVYCHEELNYLYDYPVTYSNFCKKLSATTPAYAVYAESILAKMYKSDEMKQYYTGTSIPNLDIKSLLNHNVIIPPKEVMTAFYHIDKIVFAKLYSSENILLSQIRDSLLPKLMAGNLTKLGRPNG